jgi:tetratricopeptide (TPR) repeat protein
MTPLPRFLALVLLCLTAFAVSPRPAHADDPATRSARRHFDRGEKLFALGKFDEALDEYQKAFDAKPIPEFLFNIGQCYRNLDNYDQAIFSFKKYLKLQPDASNKDMVEKLITDLEDKKDRGHGARFVVDKRKPVKPPDDPFYTRWWFWTGIAVVGVAGGVGIYEGTRSSPPVTNLGNIEFGK